MAIRAVLFDSGDTLVRPKGGAWFPGHQFADLLAEHGVAEPDATQLAGAVATALPLLVNQPLVPTLADEITLFTAFYQRVLEPLQPAAGITRLAAALARGMVEEIEFTPFDDTARVLRALTERGMPLGVISNAWPSLEWKYRQLGLRDYFHSFTISALVGAFKPEQAIFAAGTAGFSCDRREMLFVDDSPANVEAAAAFGLQAVLITRDRPAPATGEHTHTTVRDLGELQTYLANLA